MALWGPAGNFASSARGWIRTGHPHSLLVEAVPPDSSLPPYSGMYTWFLHLFPYENVIAG
jgi:hypothetical protein